MRALMAGLVLVSTGAFAAEEDCTLKLYTASTLEAHQGLVELYGIEKGPGLGYLTLTCINPVVLKSHALSDIQASAGASGERQTLELKEFLDVNRYLYVGNFNYESGVPVEFNFSVLAAEADQAQTLSYTGTFYYR